MKYEVKNFEHLLGLKGFSDNSLKTHFALYQGYVNNTNKLRDELQTLAKEEKLDSVEHAELKRRLGWEFNGMRLHEYYFGALSKESKPLSESSALYKKIEKDFGSFGDWNKMFRAVASQRGIGWAILYYDVKGDQLLDFWINEHDTGHPAGCVPLLNLDVFEHAFMLDYGTKRADYIEAFMNAVDWKEVSKRFDSAK
jgi:Fe-Mn family superoxide dismutase